LGGGLSFNFMFFINNGNRNVDFNGDSLNILDFDRNGDGKVQVYIDFNGIMRGEAIPLTNEEREYIFRALEDVEQILGIEYEIVDLEVEFGELTFHKINDLSNYGLPDRAVGVNAVSADKTRTHVYWETTNNTQQLQHILYHELGHALGIDHPDDVFGTSSDIDLMGYKTDNDPIAYRDLNIDELRSIYHQYELKESGQQDFVSPSISGLDPLTVSESTEGGGTIQDAAPVDFNLSIDGVYVQTGVTNDNLTGSDGNDFIRAGAGDDVIFGGLGDDIIRGGNGSDLISGQRGADSFYWTVDQVDNDTDTITDFNFDEGDRVFLGDGINYTISGNVLSLSSDVSGQTLFTDVVFQNLQQIDELILS